MRESNNKEKKTLGNRKMWEEEIITMPTSLFVALSEDKAELLKTDRNNVRFVAD